MIETLVDGAKAVAAAQARHLVDVAAFVHKARRADATDEIESGAAGRGALTEVALALRVSRASVERQYALGQTLIEDFPRLLEAFLAGDVTQAACWKVVSGTEVVDSSQRRAIDHDVTADALDMTPAQLERAVRRRVIAIDPVPPAVEPSRPGPTRASARSCCPTALRRSPTCSPPRTCWHRGRRWTVRPGRCGPTATSAPSAT